MQKKYLFWLIFIFILTNTININAQYGRGTKFKEAEIHYEKGQDYLRTKIVVKGETRSKYYEKAISEFKQALYIDPDYTDALFHLGECYYHVGDYKQCITTFQRLHELVNNESTNNWINLRLSLCYEKIGNKEEAEKHSKRIIRNYVSDENPSIETDLTKLKNEISNLKRSHNYNPSIFVGSPIIEKYKHLAMDYAKKGMCGKAVEVHRAMMQEYPQILPYNGSTAEENIMKCYEKIGAWKDLLNIYKESLPDLSHNLNWCLQELYNMNQVLKKYLATEYSNKNISILNKQVPQKWYYEIKDEMLTLSCIYNKKFIDGYFQYANKH
ncbi:MAG: tetratricopeptide repeat protein, partial [Elusimicrobiota bacterium]|nr:tetratricopeptide repeat protein [Elusimicrobiota bacterium]